MTSMKRVTISIPDEMDHKILAFRKTERFVRCSYSEIARKLMALGIEAEKAAKDTTNEATPQDAS